MELIQIISAAVVFLASLVPSYFAVKVRKNKEVFLSSVLLLSTLLIYGLGAVIESLTSNEECCYVLEICLVAAITGTITSYVILRRRNSHPVIGGIFGITMFSFFGTFLASELIRIFLTESALKFINPSMMTAFGMFIVIRFLWLRREQLRSEQIRKLKLGA